MVLLPSHNKMHPPFYAFPFYSLFLLFWTALSKKVSKTRLIHHSDEFVALTVFTGGEHLHSVTHFCGENRFSARVCYRENLITHQGKGFLSSIRAGNTHQPRKSLSSFPPTLPIFVLVRPRKREIEGPCCSPRPPPYLKGRGGGGQGQTRAVPHILHIVYTLLWSPYMVKPQDLLLRVFKKPKFFCLHRVVF